MTVTVTSAAPTNKLTTLELVKRELAITSNTDDKLIWDYIQQASDFITQYTGRKFARENITETLAARGSPSLVLERTPVVSITSVALKTSTASSTISSTKYDIQDSDAGVIFKEDGWTATTLYILDIERTPTRFGKLDWTIIYVSGYITPGSTQGDRTLPYDVERACVDIVKSWYLRRSFDPNVKSQRTGDASETLFESQQGTVGIPPSSLSVLDRWKRADIY